MLQLIGILFDLGVGACALLAVACVVRRVMVGRRTRCWISTIEEDELAQAVGLNLNRPDHADLEALCGLHADVVGSEPPRDLGHQEPIKVA